MSVSRHSGGIFDIDNRLIRLDEEQQRTANPSFWDNPQEAEKQLKKINAIKRWTDGYAHIEQLVGDVLTIVDFIKEEAATEQELEEHYTIAIKALEDSALGKISKMSDEQLKNVSKDIFDPSKSSPPNEFMNKLQIRMKNYNSFSSLVNEDNREIE